MLVGNNQSRLESQNVNTIPNFPGGKLNSTLSPDVNNIYLAS